MTLYSVGAMSELTGRLAQGDDVAFTELYDVYGDRLHHYLTVKLASRENADDVLQETFIRLIRLRHRLKDVADLAAYVFTIARNEAARYRSRQDLDASRRAGLKAADLFVEYSGEDAEIAAAALNRLDKDEREVVEMKIYAGLTFREIAEVSGVPQGTVATRYRSAMERLKRWLNEESL